MAVKITVYTGKYSEILFYFTEIHTIITQTFIIFLMSQRNIRVSFFRVFIIS